MRVFYRVCGWVGGWVWVWVWAGGGGRGGGGGRAPPPPPPGRGCGCGCVCMPKNVRAAASCTMCVLDCIGFFCHDLEVHM